METVDGIYLTIEQWNQAREIRRWAANQRMVRVAKGNDEISAQSLIDGCEQ